MDCERAIGKPRWLGLSKYYILKHCILCCQGEHNECTCNSIKEWAVRNGMSDIDFQVWCDYFYSGHSVVVSKSGMGYNLCKAHYVNLRAAYHNRACVFFVEDSTTTKWTIGQKLLGPLKEDYDLAPSDWVCNKCYKDIGFSKSKSVNNSKGGFSK